MKTLKSSLKTERDKLRFFLKANENKVYTRALAMPESRFMLHFFADALARQIRSITEGNFAHLTGMLKIDASIVDRVAANLRLLGNFIDIGIIKDWLVITGNIGGQGLFRAIGAKPEDFRLEDPALIKQLEERAEWLLRSVGRSTRDWIARTISRGLRKGYTNDEIAALINEGAGDISLWRAELIVHAETVNAISIVEMKTAEENGIQRKKWVSRRDDRVTDGCLENDEASIDKWFAMGDPFPAPDFSGNNVLAPPRHPRCRCRLKFDTDEVLSVEELWNASTFQESGNIWNRRLEFASKNLKGEAQLRSLQSLANEIDATDPVGQATLGTLKNIYGIKPKK